MIRALALALVLVGGCDKREQKPPPMTLNEALAVPPVVHTKLDKIAAIATQLAGVDREHVRHGTPLVRILEGLGGKPEGNTVLIHAEDLSALDQLDTANVSVRVPGSDPIQLCWSAVRHNRDASLDNPYRGGWRYTKDFIPEVIASTCATTGHASFLAVIEEAAVPATAGAERTPTFRAGAVKGRLLVWNLDTGVYEGAIEFAAESSERVQYEAPSADRRGDKIEDVVAQDLSNKALDAVDHALTR